MNTEYETNGLPKMTAMPESGERVILLVSSEGEQTSRENGLNPFELWRVIWGQRVLILSVTTIFVALSIAYALTATQWYRAEVVISPTAAKTTQGLSNQLGGLSGLASLAGISIGGGASSEPLAILRSRDFARAFIEEQNLMPILFAQKWNSVTGLWFSNTPDEIPDLRDGVKLFGEKVLNIQEDKKTGLVTLSVEWSDPDLAANWANLMVKQVNATLRRRALLEAETNVKYLQNELSSSPVIVLQQSIGRLLESEQQKLMLAKGNEEFAFRVIDRAQVPKWRSKPQRVQVVFLAGVLGGVFSVFLVFLRQASKRWRHIQKRNDGHGASTGGKR